MEQQKWLFYQWNVLCFVIQRFGLGVKKMGIEAENSRGQTNLSIEEAMDVSKTFVRDLINGDSSLRDDPIELINLHDSNKNRKQENDVEAPVKKKIKIEPSKLKVKIKLEKLKK